MSKEMSNAAYLDSDNEVLSIYLEQINKIPMRRSTRFLC